MALGNKFNLLIYFILTVVILKIGQTYLLTKQSETNGNVPLVNAPCGSLSGVIRTSFREKRNVYSYLGKNFSITKMFRYLLFIDQFCLVTLVLDSSYGQK